MTPRVLFVCGSINQTSQLHAVSRAMGLHAAWFSPFYGDRFAETMRRLGLAEPTIGGNKRRGWCLDYLRDHGLPVDVNGRRGPYDLYVTCSDVIVPRNIRRGPLVVVQEGILDPEGWVAWLCRRARLPIWLAGTALTGESGLYDRCCVASEGYREDFVRRGAAPSRVVVTGIPNFDDCERYRDNAFPHRGYVLACTSDTRETLKLLDSRPRFVEHVVEIARARHIPKIVFKLHPNEDGERATREIRRIAPDALVFQEGSAEEMIANAEVLVTQWSSVAFVGLALGKEVHASWPRHLLERLAPVQNGGTSARNIAAVCEELLGRRPSVPSRTPPVGPRAADALPLQEAAP